MLKKYLQICLLSLGAIVWVVLWLASAIGNFLFATLIFGSGIKGAVAGLFTFGIDLTKGSNQIIIAQREAANDPTKTLKLFQLGAVVASFIMVVTFLAAQFEKGVQQNQDQLETVSNLKEEVRRLKDQRKALGTPRSRAELQAKIDGILLDPRSEGCQVINGPYTRRWCPVAKQLEAELGRRADLEKLNTQIASLSQKRATTGTVSDQLPIWSMVSKYLDFELILVVFPFLMLVLALVEFWNGYGLKVTFEGFRNLHNGEPQPPSKLNQKQAKTAAHTVREFGDEATVDAFINKFTIPTENSYEPFAKVYNAYVAYCNKEGISPCKDTNFSAFACKEGRMDKKKISGQILLFHRVLDDKAVRNKLGL